MKTSILKMVKPLVAAITGGTRSVASAIGRVALVAAAICVAATPLSSFAAAKEATLKATGYSGSTTLTDFQALVKLSDNDAYGFSYDDCVASDGSDLWFEDANGNLIPHEVDTWNTSGDSYVWVMIPSLTRDTQIVMHWGAARTQAQTCTPSATWSGYVGVWHMNASGSANETNATGVSSLDAVAYSYNNATLSTMSLTDGVVGKGRINQTATGFSGGANGLKVSGYANSLSGDKSQFTVSGWWKLTAPTSDSTTYPRLISGCPDNDHVNYWEVYFAAQSKTKIQSLRSGNGSSNHQYTEIPVDDFGLFGEMQHGVRREGGRVEAA